MRNENIALSILVKHAENGEYLSVIEEFTALDDIYRQDKKAMYYYAEALYECEDDLVALKAYIDFINLHPNEIAVGYALIGVALCLRNLDLSEELINILSWLEPDYQTVTRDYFETGQLDNMQKKAKSILYNFLKHPQG